MKTLCKAVLMCSIAAQMWAQQVIDRVVTVVNGRVVTQSDWDEQERFEALADGRPAEQLRHSPAALERLIDRVLLLQQMAELNFRAPSPELVQQQIDDIKRQHTREKTVSDAAWTETLKQYGIPEEDFIQIVTEQAGVLRFIDVRFRSNTRITPFEIENYYRDTFVPEFKNASHGKTPPPLKQVQDKIQEILVEQRASEGLASFVQSLRTQAVIRTVSPVTEKK